MEEIYFDNSATTALSERCAVKVCEVLNRTYANPSSLHTKGYHARKVVEDARKSILATLGTDTQRHRLIFCGSGSEANNLAILGVLRSKKWHFTPKVLVGMGEHPSVGKCAEQLEREGVEVVYIPTINGQLDMNAVREHADKRVVLCSFMTVNNETGALYDTKSAFAAVKSAAPDAVCHTDCVQAYMKVMINANSCGADLISISAHKIHGPKGIGALVVSPDIIKRKLLSPVIYGGGQEMSLRAGTENTAYIAGFAEAATEARTSMSSFSASAAEIYSYISDRIENDPSLLGFAVNRPERHVPYIISITTPNIKSETMLHFLSGEGIYVSSGSACSSHSKDPSPALSAFGLSSDLSDRTIRVSLCRYNTLDEAKVFVEALKKGAQTLVGYKK